MYSPSGFLFIAVVTLARIAAATPPACFIAALGVQPDPSDMKALCGTLEPQVAGNITEKCSGSAESSAIAVYSSSCLASESVKITIAPTTTKSSAPATGTASTTDAGTKQTGTQSGASPTGTNAASLSSSQSGLILAPIALAVGLAGQYFV